MIAIVAAHGGSVAALPDRGRAAGALLTTSCAAGTYLDYLYRDDPERYGFFGLKSDYAFCIMASENAVC